jgi:hypothetical protein
MGEHSAPSKGAAILNYVRTHKGQVSALAVLAVGLVSRYIPGFPSEEVLRVVGVLLGVA